MASGDTLFILDPLSYSPPATLYATIDYVADASTPVANIPVLDFDPTTQEYAYWHVTMPANYSSGGLTFSWKGGTDNTSTGTLEIELGCIVIADLQNIGGRQ